jgi:PPOX class probable F420-dependent enzyme
MVWGGFLRASPGSRRLLSWPGESSQLRAVPKAGPLAHFGYRGATLSRYRRATALAKRPLSCVGVAMLPESARAVLESAALAHLVTLDPDGSPQVTCVWVGLEGDEIVSGHLHPQQKLRNVRRDPRVALSIEGTVTSPIGLKHYLVVHGRARVEEDGAAELLQRLARTYLGPDVTFPSMPNPPPGWVLRIEVDRVGGVGPWAGT